MRTLPTLLSLLAALAVAAPLAAAQDDDGCTHADPCPWVVDVDANGFQSYVEDEVTYTVGDWYEIMVFNDDTNQSHTLSLSGYDKTVTVPKDGMASDTGAFQLTKVGTFQLTDAPTGDKIVVHVVQGDSVASQGSSSSGSKGGPALPFVILALSLVALAAALRRRE